MQNVYFSLLPLIIAQLGIIAVMNIRLNVVEGREVLCGFRYLDEGDFEIIWMFYVHGMFSICTHKNIRFINE